MVFVCVCVGVRKVSWLGLAWLGLIRLISLVRYTCHFCPDIDLLSCVKESPRYGGGGLILYEAEVGGCVGLRLRLRVWVWVWRCIRDENEGIGRGEAVRYICAVEFC